MPGAYYLTNLYYEGVEAGGVAAAVVGSLIATAHNGADLGENLVSDSHLRNSHRRGDGHPRGAVRRRSAGCNVRLQSIFPSCGCSTGTHSL